MPDFTGPDDGVDAPVVGVGRDLLNALRAEVERVRGLTDPIEVVRHVGHVHAALRTHIEDPLSTLRLDAIGDLRSQGWS